MTMSDGHTEDVYVHLLAFINFLAYELSRNGVGYTCKPEGAV